RRPHLCRILVEELVCGDDGDAKLTGLGKYCLNAHAVCDEVLDLIAVEGEEGPFLAGEERILDDSEKEASERERLGTELSFCEIHDHPLTLVHCIADGER